MRGRHSDTQATGGHLEALVSRTKASFTTERKTMLLPMVCPRAGISGLDWFQAWTDARKRLGLCVWLNGHVSECGDGWQLA